MIKPIFKSAVFSDDYTCIIDTRGNKIKLDDQRVVHVFSFNPNNSNAAPFLQSIFAKRGLRIRFCEPTANLFYYSKLLCSGRECLAFNMFVGMFYEDVAKYSNKDEIFVYWGLEAELPCEFAAWPDVWKIFSEKIGTPNVIYSVSPTLRNNNLGQGAQFGGELFIAFILADLFDEAKYTLQTIALNKEEALKIFNAEIMKVVPNLHKGMGKLEESLKEWAKNISKIPLKATLEETPRILLFGGGAMFFLKESLTEYWYQQGIIPKVVGYHEFLLYLASDYARIYGFKKGYDNLRQQLNLESRVPSFFSPMNLKTLITSFFSSKQDKTEISLAMSSYQALDIANLINQRFRKAVQGSGVIFDQQIAYASILEEGHQFINANVITESSVIVGKYIKSIQTGIFDGLVNIAIFNCQQSKNGQAIIRALSHQYDMPLAALEVEGPWLSIDHHRLLENVAIQAKRLREAKNAGAKASLLSAATG